MREERSTLSYEVETRDLPQGRRDHLVQKTVGSYVGRRVNRYFVSVIEDISARKQLRRNYGE